MGKGGKITIGYWYSGTFHMGLCHKSLDAIYEIRGDDKTMFPLHRRFAIPVLNEVFSPPPGGLPGPITGSGAVQIDAPTLYGGEKQEGGVQGTLTVLMGEGTQVPSPALAAIEAGPRPAYLDITTCAFTGKIAAINPYIKPWRFRVGRYVQGWDGGTAWQPTLAQVGRGMNAAHIIYQCLTDTSWGASEDAADGLDLDSFLAAAQTLKNEDLGLCLKWSMSDAIGSFVGLVLDHVAGLRYIDPATNKLGIRLLRGDYDVATLATDPANLLDESDIVEMSSYQYPVINETVNEVTVRYRDVDTNKNAAVTYQNLANVQAQGKVVSETVDYRGFYKAEQAARAAARDCHSKSALLVKGQCKVKSSRWRIKVGDVLLLSWSREKCVRMPIRVLKVNYGDAAARTLTISWAQDEFGVPASTYVQPAPGQWQEPDTAPTPLTVERVIETPYRELARVLDTANLNALAADSGYLLAMGARPAAGVAQNFELVTRTGSANFAMRGAGDFSPRGTLAAAIGPLDSAITLNAPDALDLVATGTAALIDDEILRVDAIDTSTGAVTVGRGCADTVPAAHAAGAVVWFFQDYAAADRTEYLTGEAVDAKLLTVASQGMLDPALATTHTTTLAQRQARPYPPGNFQLNGQAYPDTLTGAITATWAHRDRQLQSDQLVDTTQADVGPEAGTTYHLRYYLDGTLVNEESAITGTIGTPYTYSAGGLARIELQSERDGLTSWQSQVAEFTYEGAAVTNFIALPLTYDEQDYAGAMTWVRQGNGPHVTPQGFEGDGYEARLKSTAIPTWMQPAAAALTVHASIAFYPQQLKSSYEPAVYAGNDNPTPLSKLILCTLPDAINATIAQLVLRGNTGTSTYVEKRFGRSGWKFERRIPDVTASGFGARPQCVAFIDSNTYLLSAHYEDNFSRFYKISKADGSVLGQFDCGSTYKHLTCCAFNAAGDFWAVDSTTFKTLRIDLAASFSSGSMVVIDVCDTSALHQVGAIEFVTVSGTEYLLLNEYDTTGTVYLYVIPASLMGTTTLTAASRYKRFPSAYEVQGHCMRSGKLYVSSFSTKGGSTRYGYVQRFDIVTAIISTADGGTITAEATWDAPGKYVEDVAIDPATNALWMPTEGMDAVGSDLGYLAVWSSPLDGSLVENHYTCEYDGAGATAIKVNGLDYDTMPGTLYPDVATVCIGGLPQASAGTTNKFFTGYVRNVVLQDQPMTTAQYNAAVNGTYEPNSLTAHEFVLTNPGAESGSTTGWTAESGGMVALTYPTNTGTLPHGGNCLFSGGNNATSISRQRLDVLAQTGLTGAQIDAGGIWAKVRWWQTNADTVDSGAMGIRTLNASQVSTGEAYAGVVTVPNVSGSYRPWYPRTFSANLLSGTRYIDALIKQVRPSGTANDAQFDDIRVTVYRQ